MNQPSIIAERRAQIDRMQANHPEWHADKFLSALGHPGYGIQASGEYLDSWLVNPHLNLHQICIEGL